MTNSVFSGDVCRLCLWRTNSLLAIFGQSGDKQGVAKKIRTLLPFRVSPDDPLPKGVCPNCVYKLEMFFEFYNACITSNDKLKKYLLGPASTPIIYVHDEPDEEIAKLETLEDPIAINCEDFQQSLNFCDVGGVSFENSGSCSDFENSAAYHGGSSTYYVVGKDNGSSYPDGHAGHHDSGTENNTCMLYDDRTSSPRNSPRERSSVNTITKHIPSNASVRKISPHPSPNVQSSPDIGAEKERESLPADMLPVTSSTVHDATVTSSSGKEVVVVNAANQTKVGHPGLSVFTCSRCSQKFKTRALLNLHYCSAPRDTVLFCRYCDRGFKSTHHLALHKKVHLTRSTYTCKECGKKFKTPKAIKSHRVAECRTVNVVSLDHMYSSTYGTVSVPSTHCDICRKSCATTAVYARHLKSKLHRHNLYKQRCVRSKKMSSSDSSSTQIGQTENLTESFVSPPVQEFENVNIGEGVSKKSDNQCTVIDMNEEDEDMKDQEMNEPEKDTVMNIC